MQDLHHVPYDVTAIGATAVDSTDVVSVIDRRAPRQDPGRHLRQPMAARAPRVRPNLEGVGHGTDIRS
jgi:hypothetical protein